MLPYILFGVREVPQASTSFTPFELLFGHQPRSQPILDVAREAWEQQPAPLRTTVEHVREMRERIDRVMPLVRERLASPLPRRTHVLQHDIRTPPGVIVRQRPYRVPEARQQAIEEEVQKMLKLGVTEPSRSPWSSPIVMVPKLPGVSSGSRTHKTPGEEDLTRKGQPEKASWGPTPEEAFQRIKTALTPEPVLRAPDFNCPFLLQTDASDTGLGAVRSQVQDDASFFQMICLNCATTVAWKMTSLGKRKKILRQAINWCCQALLDIAVSSDFSFLSQVFRPLAIF
ncbi:hypothetical protein QQF64_020589 [Cirrhinus molitorella]|uniref:Reverse transcriptase/retrotransposon-derived protein RNase H-like domain-containing protein n=1 Tax=Cirrhinus molitorella TaxID=172907 RepID=A0ABR3LD08_9TELE